MWSVYGNTDVDNFHWGSESWSCSCIIQQVTCNFRSASDFGIESITFLHSTTSFTKPDMFDGYPISNSHWGLKRYYSSSYLPLRWVQLCFFLPVYDYRRYAFTEHGICVGSGPSCSELSIACSYSTPSMRLLLCLCPIQFVFLCKGWVAQTVAATFLASQIRTITVVARVVSIWQLLNDDWPHWYLVLTVSNKTLPICNVTASLVTYDLE